MRAIGSSLEVDLARGSWGFAQQGLRGEGWGEGWG